MATLLRLSPEVVLDRYLAVTAIDSGIRAITEEEREAGWSTGGEIAYSPLIASTDSLQFQRGGVDRPGYDEWYVFKAPRQLGVVVRASNFEMPPGPGRTWVFVRTPNFALHDPKPDALHEWFWRQMSWIQPESYIADGRDCLTIVTNNKALLDRFEERLAAEPRP